MFIHFGSFFGSKHVSLVEGELSVLFLQESFKVDSLKPRMIDHFIYVIISKSLSWLSLQALFAQYQVRIKSTYYVMILKYSIDKIYSVETPFRWCCHNAVSLMVYFSLFRYPKWLFIIRLHTDLILQNVLDKFISIVCIFFVIFVLIFVWPLWDFL